MYNYILQIKVTHVPLQYEEFNQVEIFRQLLYFIKITFSQNNHYGNLAQSCRENPWL